ncbi:MSI2, partial [Acrasis kona]
LRQETEFIVNDLKFSKYDDKGLLGITADTFETKYVGQLTYWRLSTTGQLDEIQSVGLETGGVCLSESSGFSSFIYTGHTDPILRLWTKNNLVKPIKRYTYHNMSAEDLSTSPFDSEEFVSCSKDSSFAMWTMTESEPIFTAVNEASYPMLGVTYHPQNPSLLIAAPLDGRLELWNREDRKRIYTITPPDDLIFSCMSINPFDEYNMAVADETGHTYMWDLRKLRRPVHHFQAHSLAVSQIKFNPHDDKLLGTGGTDGFFHLWFMGTNQSKQEEQEDRDKENALRLSGVETSTGNLNVECLRSFKTHTLPITTWDWSVHDLGLIGDAGSDYSLFLWNFVTEDDD